MNCVSFHRNEGCYNLCNTKEKSAQYIFNWGIWEDKAKELGLQRSFLIEIDKDCNYSFPTYDALELANELDSIISGYWINSNKTSIKKVLEFLESVQEENEIEMCKDMISDYTNKLDELNDRLEKAKYNLGQKRYYEELESQNI